MGRGFEDTKDRGSSITAEALRVQREAFEVGSIHRLKRRRFETVLRATWRGDRSSHQRCSILADPLKYRLLRFFARRSELC